MPLIGCHYNCAGQVITQGWGGGGGGIEWKCGSHRGSGCRLSAAATWGVAAGYEELHLSITGSVS